MPPVSTLPIVGAAGGCDDGFGVDIGGGMIVGRRVGMPDENCKSLLGDQIIVWVCAQKSVLNC